MDAECSDKERCEDGECVLDEDETCARGEEGCACKTSGACDQSADGAQLACQDGVCEEVACAPGVLGCACDGTTCDAGLVCSAASGQARCEPEACVEQGVAMVGVEGCGCQLDRTCDAGLACVAGACEALDCNQGASGCACAPDYTCDAGAECDLETTTCRTPGECTPGNLGCACEAQGGCVDGLTCQDDVCEQAGCPAGGPGCACRDGECGYAPNGEALECLAGVCEQVGCPSGSAGCACLAGDTCEDGATCVDGACRLDDCTPGSLGCGCLAGSCAPGLACSSAVCVDQTGRLGGSCYEDGTCARNARCDTTLVDAACVYCDLGTIGCQCRDDDSCNPGLSCLNGHCAGDETVHGRERVEDPVCYTPCTQGTSDGGRTCSPEGLMEGCADDLECVDGSCVPQGSSAPVCFEDAQCPDFQLCIQGGCYAQCARDSECGQGERCYRAVCRQPCTLDQSSCGAGQVCESSDGQSGFCVQGASTTSLRAQAPAPQGFALSEETFRLSNVNNAARVIFYNDTARRVTATVTRNEHFVVRDDGSREQINVVDGCVGAQCPLWWLEIGEFGQIGADPVITVEAPPRCRADDSCPELIIRMPAQGVDAVSWKGSLLVESSEGQDQIYLEYSERPDGQWGGKMVYFATFDDAGVDSDAQGGRGWLARDRDLVSGQLANDLPVVNGLLQRWEAFRNGGLSGGWAEFEAVLTATETGQWSFPNVEAACPLSQGACYLFADPAGGMGVRNYVTSLANSPIPTGATSLPMAINMRASDPLAPAVLTGKVDSSVALHYAGDPAVTLRFAEDPGATTTCDPGVNTNCVHFLAAPTSAQDPPALELDAIVGGRFPKVLGVQCPDGFEERDEPWLVPGFLADAQLDTSGFYSRAWCVDVRLPTYTTPIEDITPEARVENSSLARANPVPDGQVLPRAVEVLDGAMIDQRQMILFFRERTPNFLGGDDIIAYGYMLLARRPVALAQDDLDGDGVPDDYQGNTPPAGIQGAAAPQGLSCSPALLDEVLGQASIQTEGEAAQVVSTLLNGATNANTPIAKPTGNAQGCTSAGIEVHYLCEDTGLFDGGPDNTACWGAGQDGPNTNGCGRVNGSCEDGGVGAVSARCARGTDVTDCGPRYNDARIACPPESNITYFTAPASAHAQITGHACQDTGTCASVLANWAASGATIRAVNPSWKCEGGATSCDDDLLDRRAGKVFYDFDAGVPFNALRPEIADAFRYKTRFVGRDGTNIGFEPSICVPFSDTTPYCYDPGAIEQLRERSDCLLAIYRDWYSAPNAPSNLELFDYLEEHFSQRAEPNPQGGDPTLYDGFERLNAELMVMLGDKAYTSSFESRFDLAGSSSAGFDGARFEDDGLVLSGIAGFEMVELHRAVQYYSMALNRFYGMSDVIEATLAAGPPATARNFISEATVTAYFDRLIRASTQRSRAWSEIARRYQSFNRPDLARRVAVRAYTSTYLESVALSNLILDIYEISGGSRRAQILVELEKTQRRYRMALLDLSNVYNSIVEDVNFFGFSPDYIPFPALGTAGANADVNAFDHVYRLAQSKLDAARSREITALQQTREFDTNEASFQAELTRITRTYEQQLGDICGIFTAPDGKVYPAVRRHAFRDPRYAPYGDPCGFVGNGQIHNQLVEMDLARLEVQRIIANTQGLYESIRIAKERVEAVCDVQLEIGDFEYRVGQQLYDLEEGINASQQTMELSGRAASTAMELAKIQKCDVEDGASDCLQAAALTATTIKVAAADATLALAMYGTQTALRARRNDIELRSGRWRVKKECEIAEIELNAETETRLLDLTDLEIGLISANYRLAQVISEIGRLRQQAQRVQLEQDESIDLNINVEAAKSDPNVRIYRNDAVINADIAFEDAVREAYRLTLVYEYYTSQTYAARDQLFLTRMVSSGDYNLENYVADLRNAFETFEEEFGNPDTRVMVVSLRDDILKIPRVDEEGRALTNNERSALLREAVTDPARLNADGYITLPFATRLDELSPLTRNHKVLYMEANIEGNDNGDYLGRLYLRQAGTATINAVTDTSLAYRFPARTAVINPFFSGTREFAQSPEIYRNFRLRDRPLVNNGWELIINQRDEAVNQDINLNALTDIKLYVFYTDFTLY